MNNPYSVTDVGTFSVETYEVFENTNYLIDAGSSDGVYSAEPNLITEGLSVTASSYVTSDTPVTYTVTFTPASFVPSGAIIEITIPADIEIPNEAQT